MISAATQFASYRKFSAYSEKHLPQKQQVSFYLRKEIVSMIKSDRLDTVVACVLLEYSQIMDGV